MAWDFEVDFKLDKEITQFNLYVNIWLKQVERTILKKNKKTCVSLLRQVSWFAWLFDDVHITKFQINEQLKKVVIFNELGIVVSLNSEI